MEDYEEDQFRVAKKNRRGRQDRDRDRMIVDGQPPSGVHKESRKSRDKRRNQAVRRAGRR